MKVNYQAIDDLTAKFTVELEQTDYEPKVEESLKKFRKQVSMNGFRPGQAPMGVVKKMYGKSVLVEEVNQMASKALFEYLKEHNIDVLGQPMLSDMSDSDFDNPSTFSFGYDLGLAPTFTLNISATDTLTRYKIQVSDAMLDDEINKIRMRQGVFEASDNAGVDDIIYGELSELDADGNMLEGGVENKKMSTTPGLIKDEDLKSKLMNTKAGDVLEVNIQAMFNNNESVIKNTLEIPEEAVNDLNPTFKFVIEKVETRIPAELNKEFFEKVYPGVNLETEADFKDQVKKDLEAYFDRESQHFVEHQAVHLMDDKHPLTLPDEFLKRWLKTAHEKEYTDENIDERYVRESGSLRNMMVVDKIIAENNLVVDEDMLRQHAINDIFDMYRQMGYYYPDPQQIVEFADKELKNEEYRHRMEERSKKSLAVKYILDTVTIEEKDIAEQEFYELLNQHKH